MGDGGKQRKTVGDGGGLEMTTEDDGERHNVVRP